jgi:glycosyltransferase involved in cell wall biosynthesis
METGPIRVLLVSRIHGELGGGHFIVARLANYFSRSPSLGVFAQVLINDRYDFMSKFVDPSVPWYPFEVPAPALSVRRQTRSWSRLLRSIAGILFFLPHLTAKIKKICKENQIEIIHVHANTALVLLALPAKLAGCKLLFHLHDTFLTKTEGGVFSPVNRRVLWFAMRYFADVIFVVSDFVRRTVLQFDQRLSDKVQILRNGIDVANIRQDKLSVYKGGNPSIVSYGVLATHKGFQAGIEALSILKHDYGIRARYQIIGDGPFHDDLVSLARELRVSDVVEFVAFQKQVHRYVSLADIVLIPPVYEDPCPLVVLEAMANSKIIIASRSGGIPEMIRDGVEGYLVDRNDPRQIADRVVQIMNNPQDANRMADNAYRRVKQEFSIKGMAERLVNIYHSVL